MSKLYFALIFTIYSCSYAPVGMIGSLIPTSSDSEQTSTQNVHTNKAQANKAAPIDPKLLQLSKETMVIKTTYGDIKIKFFSNAAPNTIKLIKEQVNNNVLFKAGNRNIRINTMPISLLFPYPDVELQEKLNDIPIRGGIVYIAQLYKYQKFHSSTFIIWRPNKDSPSQPTVLRSKGYGWDNTLRNLVVGKVISPLENLEKFELGIDGLVNEVYIE